MDQPQTLRANELPAEADLLDRRQRDTVLQVIKTMTPDLTVDKLHHPAHEEPCP